MEVQAAEDGTQGGGELKETFSINRGECRADGLLSHMNYARPQRGIP